MQPLKNPTYPFSINESYKDLRNIWTFFLENNLTQEIRYNYILTLNYEMWFWEQLTKFFSKQNSFLNKNSIINLHGNFNKNQKDDHLYTDDFALFEHEKKLL